MVALGRAENAASPLAFVSAIRIGRAENQNAGTEARWILETLDATALPLAKWICS